VTMCDHMFVIIVVKIEEDETVKIKYSKPLAWYVCISHYPGLYLPCLQRYCSRIISTFVCKLPRPTVILGYLPGLNRRQLQDSYFQLVCVQEWMHIVCVHASLA